MNKSIILHDDHDLRDNCSIMKGKVQIKLAGTDKVLFEGYNKVTLMGAEILMRAMFSVDSTASDKLYKSLEEIVTSDNYIGGLNASTANNNITKYIQAVYPTTAIMNAVDKSTINDGSAITSVDNFRWLWFAVGNDGTESGQSFTTKSVSRNAPIGLKNYIPFRHVDTAVTSVSATNMLNAGYGLSFKSAGNANVMGFFAKNFDEFPTLNIVDGSTIKYDLISTASVPGVSSGDRKAYPNTAANPQAYIEMKMSISSTDCREYFAAANDSNRVINTISILGATPVKIKDGVYAPKFVRPVTKLNFPSESLADDSKGLDITYQIYF